MNILVKVHTLLSINCNIMLSLASQLWGFYDGEIRPLFGPIVLIVFVIGCLFNLGMVLNPNDRDWKGFFFAVGRFVMAVVVIIGVAEIIRGYSLR